jgi:hypothetical protein
LSLINVIGGDFVPPARGRLSKQPRELSDEMERGHPVWKKSIYLGHGCDQDKRRRARVVGCGQRNADEAIGNVRRESRS